MSYCRNFEKRIDDLRRCGCRRCEEEYYHEQKMYDGRWNRRLTYDPLQNSMLLVNKLTVVGQKEPKMEEEPKNIAVKILVDKLKAEQMALASTETQLKLYETYVKSHRESKSKNLHAIKELAAALKKLGHKVA